jgi:hypothetical protein
MASNVSYLDSVGMWSLDPDPDPSWQNYPQTKYLKSEEISCFEVLYVFFGGLEAVSFA